MAGMQAFDTADYHAAIRHWELAYRLDCAAHALLLNLARAHELAGNRPAAAQALRTYLAREPQTSRRAQIERRIQRLEQP